MKLENEQELNAAILAKTILIQEKYPELSKYLLEMPVSIPDTESPQINVETLTKYLNSLEELLNNYLQSEALLKTNTTNNNMKKLTKWTIDQSHSEISFKVRHLMIAHVKGYFSVYDGSIYTTGNDFLTAEIDIAIDPSSIYTGDKKRDEHLKSVDFFDVLNHKNITFTSSTIGKADTDGNHELWGELTIKGVTKNLKLNVEFGGIANDPWGKEKAGFTITGKINRSDFGLTWNTAMEAGGMMVSDEIKIMCEIELTNIAQQDAVMEIETPTAATQ